MVAGTVKAGVRLQPHDVLLRPLLTEKGVHRSQRYRQYAFEISPAATKKDVRDAVEELFPDSKVMRVRTQNRKGKPRRFRFKLGRTKDWKKAIVTLHPESRAIEFF